MGEYSIISIHALREEGDPAGMQRKRLKSISIHALREEGDHWNGYGQVPGGISIHALREEGDNAAAAPGGADCYFYPRPP